MNRGLRRLCSGRTQGRCAGRRGGFRSAKGLVDFKQEGRGVRCRPGCGVSHGPGGFRAGGPPAAGPGRAGEGHGSPQPPIRSAGMGKGIPGSLEKAGRSERGHRQPWMCTECRHFFLRLMNPDHHGHDSTLPAMPMGTFFRPNLIMSSS